MPRRSTRRTPRKPRQARSQATVDAILEATAELLVRDGPRTTTNHIAERAGVSIGSLYQYFPNKAALYAALTARHVARVKGAMAQIPQRIVGSPTVDPSSVLELVLDVERQHLALSSVLHGLAWQYPAVAAHISELRTEQMRVATLMQQHLAPDGDPQAQGVVARSVMRALGGMMQRTLAEEPALLHDPHFMRVLIAFFEMFRTLTQAATPEPGADPAPAGDP